jgi:DNA-binding transcriptional regulator YdaS (Cro superfamily)
MRKKSGLVEQANYTPNHLLDTLMEKLEVGSDAALARVLDIPPSTISKIRHKQVSVNSALLLAAHEATEISIRELRQLMGDVTTRYWLGNMGHGLPSRKTATVRNFPGRRREQPSALQAA